MVQFYFQNTRLENSRLCLFDITNVLIFQEKFFVPFNIYNNNIISTDERPEFQKKKKKRKTASQRFISLISRQRYILQRFENFPRLVQRGGSPASNIDAERRRSGSRVLEAR